MTTSYQGFEIPVYQACEALPEDLLEVDPVRVFQKPAVANKDLKERATYYGRLAVEERSLRLQLIGALKMRDASSGRKREFFEEQAAEIRAKIEEFNKIEAKPEGFFARLNPFD